ncbi:EAL domain-containing protein [Cnuibacter sp. UC19_7]|uniref:EAL domain-containing protein n=1 Tax=Cnuibacter sp. UC19_7 TaxID=3350166 RepID=UPI00366F73F4
MLDATLSTVFQPVVDLSTGEPVAYEALSRMQSGDFFIPPHRFFDEARSGGDLLELDAECWATSLATAREQGFRRPHSLLINIEPASFEAGLMLRMPPEQPVVIELTERALLARPGELLAMADAARAAGHAIAVDDLGAHAASLALLPLLDPDIVKLDMRLVQDRPSADLARIMGALDAHLAGRDVVVIAEGIETDEHLVTARALGATHGQGWLYSAAMRDVPDAGRLSGIPLRSSHVTSAPLARTPYEVVSARVETKPSNRELLVQMSVFLEARARTSGDSAVVLATFQESSNISPSTLERYTDLAAECGLVIVYARGVSPALLATGSRVHDIVDGDPLVDEWDIVVLTADFAAALVARESDPAHHEKGDYRFALTHERALVVEAARSLLADRA